jgi:4-hydroxy-3-polyprenylbenzoate decarboxylase
MHKIVVAITGASGSIYPKILLNKLMSLKDQWSALGIIITDNAKIVWQTELGDEAYTSYDARYFTKNDFMAPFASGSGDYDIMIIAPCSMGTLGRIASGVSGDLISRAADVILKERRKLICVVRETPYNLIHIRNMETVTMAGGIICPATPSFYSRPQTIEEAAATVVDRIIGLAGLKIETFRWGG